MSNKKSFFIGVISILFLASCGLFGLHLNVHNPRKPGKYPKFDRETILLGELTPIREAFDVVHYDIDIGFDIENKSINGWVETKSVALKNIDSIQLDLDQQMNLNEVRFGSRSGEELSYKRIERAIFIKLPNTVAKGDTFSVFVKYSGEPIKAKKPPWDGGFVWKEDKEDNPWVGVACEVEGASIWLPTKDHTSDEPNSVDLRFTIPNGNLEVISNGQFVGEEVNGNEKSFMWKVTKHINLYNITFYIGDFAKIEDEYVGINGKKMVMNHYVLHENKVKATRHFKQLQRQIKAYEELYGEYPWYEDGFKLVESPFAGMEHQSAIAYGNSYKNDMNGTDDYIIVHEAGHEWFGNAVTASDLADVWLQEGFTTYGEALYLEKLYGKNVYSSHISFYRWMIKNKYPVVGPKGRRYFDYKDGDVYVKGAWILHSLRNTIDDDAVFFDIIKTFYQENNIGVTDSEAFIEVVERKTGEKYNWFFDQYLHVNTVPTLEYEHSKDGYFYYRWTGVKTNFDKLPIEIYVIGVKGEVLKLYPNTKIQREKIGVDNEVNVSGDKVLFAQDENKKLDKLFSGL